jgi:hypothetical protein
MQSTRRKKKADDPMDRKQICVTDKNHQSKILDRFVIQMKWHPLTHTRVSETSDTVADIKENWQAQVMDMHDLCKELNESWAWEYLWNNWYRPDRWTLWARAASNWIPISNTNAMVESLWSVFKKKYLRRYSRPKLEYMVQVFMDQYFENHLYIVNAFRNGCKDPTWYGLL